MTFSDVVNAIEVQSKYNDYQNILQFESDDSDSDSDDSDDNLISFFDEEDENDSPFA
jgi:hypothetical protein